MADCKDVRGRTMLKASSSTKSGSTSQARIPKFPAVSLSRSNTFVVSKGEERQSPTSEKEKKDVHRVARRSVTCNVLNSPASRKSIATLTQNHNDERKSVQKVNEKNAEVVVAKPQRRQWSSFDVGQPPLELDGDVMLPQWQSKSFFGVVGSHEVERKDFDVGQGYEEVEENRRHSKVHTNMGDQCFRKLKENLADEGTKESLLQMAKDLLSGLDLRDASAEEEASYRQEEALFWLMKASERGSYEAWTKLKQMAERGEGVTESNRAEVAYFIDAKHMDELVGNRIGQKTFEEFVGQQGVKTMFSLSRLSETRIKQGGQTELITRTRQDRVTLEEMKDSGRRYLMGNVTGPLDRRLMSYEISTNQLSMMLSLLIKFHLMLTVIHSYILAILCLPAVQTTMVLVSYHMVTNSKLDIVVLCQTTAEHLLFPSVIVVAASASSFCVISHQRRNNWRRIFAKTLDPQETKRADERWSRSNDDRATVNLALTAIASASLAVLSKNNYDYHFNSMAVATGALMWIFVRNRWTGLFVTGAIFFLRSYEDVCCEHLEVVFPENIPTLPYPVLISVLAFLPTILLAGFRSGSEIMCASVLSLSVFNLGNESERWTWNLISLSLLLISVNSAALKNLKAPGRRSNSWTFFTLAMILLASSYLVNIKRIVEEAKSDNITNPSPLTWTDFSTTCPQEEFLPVARQVECLQTFGRSYVEWEGTVTSVQAVPKLQRTFSELVATLTARLRKECSCDNETDGLMRQLCCYVSMKVPLRDPRAHECLVRMQSGHNPSSLFARELTRCQVEVAMGSDMWEICSQLQPETDIIVAGELVYMFCPKVDAISVQIVMH